MAASIPSEFDVGRFLDWFTNRDDAVLASVPDRLRDLPIFPTGTRVIGLLARWRFRSRGSGIPSISLMCCTSRDVPRDSCVPAGTRRAGADAHALLHRVRRARGASPASTTLSAARCSTSSPPSCPGSRTTSRSTKALADLPLVPCTDGVPRRGAEVYFAGVDPLLVGPDRPIASTPTSPGARRLYEWLGVVFHTTASRRRRPLSFPSIRSVEPPGDGDGGASSPGGPGRGRPWRATTRCSRSCRGFPCRAMRPAPRGRRTSTQCSSRTCSAPRRTFSTSPQPLQQSATASASTGSAWKTSLRSIRW